MREEFQPCSNRSRPTITAMVIDDDVDTASVLTYFLQIKGITVVGEEYDGAEAVKTYKKLLPDVVFLDVIMEKHDGFYTLEKIREIQSDAIVILITADVTKETRERLEKLHASAIIYKPYDINEVMDTANKLVLKLKRELVEDINSKKAQLRELNFILKNHLHKSEAGKNPRAQYFDEKEKWVN